jgi:N utilization substance protein B
MMQLKDIKPGQGEEIAEDEKRISPRTQSRRVALQALYQWHLNHSEFHDIIKQFNEDGRLSNLDIELFNELVDALSTQHEALDALYADLLDRKVSMIDPIEKIILRMGVYELKNSLAVPYKSVLNEAVELTKSFGAEASHKYINGILDKVAQNLRAAEIKG